MNKTALDKDEVITDTRAGGEGRQYPSPFGLQRDDPNILLSALRADMSSMVESMAWIKNNISMMAHVPATVAGLTEKVAANTTEIRENRVRVEAMSVAIDDLKLQQAKQEVRLNEIDRDIIPDGKPRMASVERDHVRAYALLGTITFGVLAYFGRTVLLPLLGIHI